MFLKLHEKQHNFPIYFARLTPIKGSSEGKLCLLSIFIIIRHKDTEIQFSSQRNRLGWFYDKETNNKLCKSDDWDGTVSNVEKHLNKS